MTDNIDFGKKGEELAVEYLQKKGYKILERNWRSGRNEIDIVAQDGSGKYVVIVEVKSRRSLYGGEPEAAVTRDKQRALINAANAFLNVKKLQNEVRFDIISILINQEGEKIHHIEDAFYPTLR